MAAEVSRFGIETTIIVPGSLHHRNQPLRPRRPSRRRGHRRGLRQAVPQPDGRRRQATGRPGPRRRPLRGRSADRTSHRPTQGTTPVPGPHRPRQRRHRRGQRRRRPSPRALLPTDRLRGPTPPSDTSSTVTRARRPSRSPPRRNVPAHQMQASGRSAAGDRIADGAAARTSPAWSPSRRLFSELAATAMTASFYRRRPHGGHEDAEHGGRLREVQQGGRPVELGSDDLVGGRAEVAESLGSE